MSDGSGVPAEVTRFLREYPPFDALDADLVERVAVAIEVEFYRAGTTIFAQGAEPVQHLRVVRSGSVEIIHHGQILDLLVQGELFGHSSMLSGLPTGFEARAAEDTLCYRIAADAAHDLVSAPAGLRYVARSLLDTSADYNRDGGDAGRDPRHQPVGALINGSPVICGPQTPIREAAQLMTDAGATSLVVLVGDGSLGILTDRDMRTRVVAGGLGGDEPVSAAMSSPAYICPPDRPAGEVLLDMLDRGIRHFPVVSATGEIVGVVADSDIVAVQTRSSFFIRQRIARAQTVQELAAAAAELRPTVVAMHDARLAAANIMAVYSVVLDVLTRRLVELAIADAGELPSAFAWLALGSQARREATPSSDVDSAIVWFGEDQDERTCDRLRGIGATVMEGLKACGLRPDAHGASAANAVFVRSIQSWQHAAHAWIQDPTLEKALLLVSVLVDSRPVWGVHTGSPVSDTFALAPRNPDLLRLLARFALSYRPPTGFMRGLVVEHSGEHRGRLDLKHGGMLPIVDLARWAGMAAGVTSASTVERLRAAADAGTLPQEDATTLQEAFELITELRLRHQVEQIRVGRDPDDHLDPASLSQLTRSHLKEAFRAVAAVQKRVAAETHSGAR